MSSLLAQALVKEERVPVVPIQCRYCKYCGMYTLCSRRFYVGCDNSYTETRVLIYIYGVGTAIFVTDSHTRDIGCL